MLPVFEELFNVDVVSETRKVLNCVGDVIESYNCMIELTCGIEDVVKALIKMSSVGNVTTEGVV